MILFSCDAEEFDLPCELGFNYDPLKRGMSVSKYGIAQILDIFQEFGIRATFFCTVNFAENAPDELARIVRENHEIAAHGCDHLHPKYSDIAICKFRLEELTGCKVWGWRQPRMAKVDLLELQRCGYIYNASLNPAFIPGRYMNLDIPRLPFIEEGIYQIPASVTPYLRIPMFWLSLHHFPLSIYKAMIDIILAHNGQFNTYFHPWEFYPLNELSHIDIPWLIRRNSGELLSEKLRNLIYSLKRAGQEFMTYGEFARLNLY